MSQLKKVLIIIGSASSNSSNEKLMRLFEAQTSSMFSSTIFNKLKKLPHFDPELSTSNPPIAVQAFRQSIAEADGIIICTPEYIFSIPSGLKNAMEWCVATTVWEHKPLGIITASAHGQQGHEELKRIMKTVMANFNEQTTLLIQGIKGKVDEHGNMIDTQTQDCLNSFIIAFQQLLATKGTIETA